MTQLPTTYIFAGNWEYSNLGCEAIVRGTTALLREVIGNDFHILSHYFTENGGSDGALEYDPAIAHLPFPTLRRYSPAWVMTQVESRLFHRAIPRSITDTLQRSLPAANGVLMLGGDTFTADYGQADFYFGLSNAASATGLPVAIWGASVGPFPAESPQEKRAVQNLKRISLVCARETETYAYLSDLGVTANLMLTADPSFYMSPEAYPLPKEIEAILQEGCIGVNLSPLLGRYMPLDPSQGSRLDAWRALAVEIVVALQRRFAQPILLIPHVFSQRGDIERDDYAFLRAVADAAGAEGIAVLPRGLNAAQTKWVISRTRLFAGARTHSTLAAISTCVPTICIGYSRKAQGIARDVYDTLDWLIPGADLVKSPTVLCDRMVDLAAQEATLREHLEARLPLFRSRALDAAQRFVSMTSSVKRVTA